VIPALSRERRVFVDSSAHFALIDQDDDHHREAATIVERLIDGRYRFFTTNTVIIEAHALILATLGIERAAAFLQGTGRTSIRVIRSRASDEERAVALILRYRDKRFSFTDAISFVVMERLGISRALTFDRDFAQYGFAVLRADQL
jgi:uncharacterized protein